MATTKKAPAKKTPAKKPVAKKAVAKKAPVKKAAAKTTVRKTSASRPVTKKSTTSKVRSFRVDRGPQPAFTSFSITRQTVYWIILVAFIIFVQLWILKLQVEVVTLLDAQQASLSQ